MTQLQSFVRVLAAYSVLTFLGCSPSREAVVGTYRGSLNGASEELTLNSDGSYQQELLLPANHHPVTNNGSWRLQHKAVILDNYLAFYSPQANGALTKPEPRSRFIYAHQKNMLVRDFDGGFYRLDQQQEESF